MSVVVMTTCADAAFVKMLKSRSTACAAVSVALMLNSDVVFAAPASGVPVITPAVDSSP
jgi:hypothetical protein